MVEPSHKGRSSLSKSVDKEELVRRAVAHAAATAKFFQMDEDDDDEAGDVQDQPHIARDLKEELSGAAEQLANIEEAPIVTAKCFRSVLLQKPIPVIESKKLVSPTVIGLNTAAQLESDAKARAAAADRATYGVRRYEADLKRRMDEAEIDQWHLDDDEEYAARED